MRGLRASYIVSARTKAYSVSIVAHIIHSDNAIVRPNVFAVKVWHRQHNTSEPRIRSIDLFGPCSNPTKNKRGLDHVSCQLLPHRLQREVFQLTFNDTPGTPYDLTTVTG